MLPMDLGPICRLGRIMLSPTVRAKVSDHDLNSALHCHLRKACPGPQSDCPTLRRRARLDGCRLLSAYRAANGTPFWIISEADKSLTRVLLPEEYPR